MAAKRQASSDLNHDNWDHEEEPEVRGTFRTATEAELKDRVIKKAKRKIVPGTSFGTTDVGSNTKSIFSGFSGLGKPTASAATSSSPFAFLSKITVATASNDAVRSSNTSTSVVPPKFCSAVGLPTATTSTKSMESSDASVDSGPTSACNISTKAGGNSDLTVYYNKLSSLNQAVCEWIKTHVEKNPICILTPIFTDYEKYLENIESERDKMKLEEAHSLTADLVDKSSSTAAISSFKFNGGSNKVVSTNNTVNSSTSSETETKTNGFSFSLNKPENNLLDKPSTTSKFSFNLTPSTTTPSTSSSNFSFGNAQSSTLHSITPPKPFSFAPGGTPFSFGNIKPPDLSGTTNSGDDANEEDDEPPKNEFKQVVEDGAVYSKKCKVFVKKDGNFVDKGVGTLYLKPVEASSKTQLLVRADTNLGNILVNLILNSAIPAQRMGKNNVMMVCLPTPDVEKTTPILLRVKTGEEADELLENIDKFKK